MDLLFGDLSYILGCFRKSLQELLLPSNTLPPAWHVAVPNPHILMRPFVRREAVLSSKIEGTQATLGELSAAEAGAAVERSPEDLQEVA
ncbi:MAG: Fic/DOC family N-terminal domain-containing protein [Terracidiphilus sp.]